MDGRGDLEEEEEVGSGGGGGEKANQLDNKGVAAVGWMLGRRRGCLRFVGGGLRKGPHMR